MLAVAVGGGGGKGGDEEKESVAAVSTNLLKVVPNRWQFASIMKPATHLRRYIETNPFPQNLSRRLQKKMTFALFPIIIMRTGRRLEKSEIRCHL